MPRPHFKSNVESVVFQARTEFLTVVLCGFSTKIEYYVTRYPYILRDRNAYGETVLEEYRRRGGVDPVIASLITPSPTTSK